jgi:deferrochelatase/peroxidase EfeB
MGFKDGTNNIHAEDHQAVSEAVWLGGDDRPSWMQGGSYLIARRIRILLDVWDSSSLQEQQRTIGRYKLSGAPLGEHREHDQVNLNAQADGEPVIPLDAHIRVASPQLNAGQRILRRGYSYSDGFDPGTGQLDAGLFFIAYQRSPHHQFIPIQQRLATSDALNRHTLHTASAIFAIPPGAQPDGYIGDTLF